MDANKILKYVFFIGLFLSVFIYSPWSNPVFEVPKVWFVQRWIEILLFIAIFNLNKLAKKNQDNVLIISVCLFWLVVFISALSGMDPVKSFIGNYYRSDGLFTLAHILVLFFIIILFFKKAWLEELFLILSGSSAVLSLTSVVVYSLNFLGLRNIVFWDGGLGINFGNPNFLAGYLLVSLPFTAYFADRHLKKYDIWTGTLFIQIIGIILTKAWAGIFGSILFLSVWISLKLPRKRTFILLTGIVLLLVSIFIFLREVNRSHLPGILNAESRERIMTKGLLGFSKRPLTGYGWANFDYAFESVDWPIHLNNDVYVDKAHSSFVEVLVTTGVVGFTIYLAIIVRTIFLLVKIKNPYSVYLLGGFLLTVIHMQSNVVSVSEELIFWIIVALAGGPEKTGIIHKKPEDLRKR